ncbi:hypothetical protein, partial [Blautia wexlerae]|uniref:hypothetical protein n=1 Tax=Blautia wexlerae TaxID=418240 RepID=UPI001A9AE11F
FYKYLRFLLFAKVNDIVILRASEYLSMREKEKTVSLVLLPTQPQLNPKAIVAVSLILSTLCRYNTTPICELQSKYMPDAYIWYIFLKNILLKNHLISEVKEH